MTTNASVDGLLAAVDETVQMALTYFEGPGSTAKARVGEWGAWDVLWHFIFWHEATSEGMESVARGGAPYRLGAAVDELNDRVIAKYQGESFLQLTARLRELHGRLQQAARNLTDLDAPVIVRFDDTTWSGRERLEIINRHWARHVAELQAAEPS